MAAYVPEFVYGLIPGADGEHGLVPWPAHLQPQQARPDVELTKKGEAYIEASLREDDRVFFLALDKRDRTSIATTVERLINILDELDEDPDIEEGGDDEPSLGWTGNGSGTVALDFTHSVHVDLEFDNCDDEDGDPGEDGGDSEPSMGWSERFGQWEPGSADSDIGDYDDSGEGMLHFDGQGHAEARQMLRQHRLRRTRDPDELTIIRPGVARLSSAF